MRFFSFFGHMFHFLHSHGGSAPATGTATRTIDTAWCRHVVMLRSWQCDVVKMLGASFSVGWDTWESWKHGIKLKTFQGWGKEINCDRICLHFIQIYCDIYFFHEKRIPKSILLKPSHTSFMTLIDFPAVFSMSLHLSRMVSSIASPAMLGRSYALVLRMHLQSFGDLTLVKKPGNGPWRWLAQRVLFGAYQVSWLRDS